MSLAILPGTFDPVTNGHLDLIQRADRCFENVTIAVGNNFAKTPWFTADERVRMLRDAVGPSLKIVVFDGLLVDCALEVGATVIVKGLRDCADLSFELVQSTTNREIGGIETVLLPTSSRWLHVSSSLVRELTRWGGPVEQYVPVGVKENLDKLRSQNDWPRETKNQQQQN